MTHNVGNETDIDVTVNIVNWKTPDLVARCLESLEQGTMGIRAQIIVVDNASGDGSAELIRSKFPDVEVLANDHNWGFSRATNQAFALARGRYFLLLNPDTVVRPKALSIMAEFLDAHEDVAGATCKLLNLDGSFQRYYKRLPTWLIVLRTFTVLKNLTPNNRFSRSFYMMDDLFDTIREVEQPPGACLMLRRSLLSGPTLLDERFPVLFSDIDLCRTLRDRGLGLFFVPTAEVLHHGSAGGVGQMKDDAIIDYLICLIRYYRKHEGLLATALLWTILALDSLLVLAVSLVKVMLRKKDWLSLTHEFRRRSRLFKGREKFRYPAGFQAAIP